MPVNAEDPGFLSRWSRRKESSRKEMARQGGGVADAEIETAPSPAAAGATAAPTVIAEPLEPREPVEVTAVAASPAPLVQTPEAPLPTMADVALLERHSDFTRFVGRGVQPEVKNAALAKLFSDPHFNVMDRLDVYIDDYGLPDPLPASMLRQMLQAQVLGLFDDEKSSTATGMGDDAAPNTQPDPEAAPPIAPPTAAPTAPPTEAAAHENFDLQLQPDDDAGRPGVAAGPGEDTAGLCGRS